MPGHSQLDAGLTCLLACGGRGGEGEGEAGGGGRRDEARQGRAEGIAACDATSYVIVWGQAVVPGSTARHSPTQHNAMQYRNRNGRAKRREGREIKAHQVESS